MKGSTYANGEKKWEQKGSIRTVYYKNGVIRAKGKLAGGLMEGKWIFNRESGKFWQSQHFKGGKRTGQWVRYSRTGTIEHRSTWADGKRVKE